jgi:hypothetical protein
VRRPQRRALTRCRLTSAERWLEPRCPADLSEEELTALWGDELARFYIDKILIRRRPMASGEG